MNHANERIEAPGMLDNQTWNSCPDCNRQWRDLEPTPGLLHRTRLCPTCHHRRLQGPHHATP